MKLNLNRISSSPISMIGIGVLVLLLFYFGYVYYSTIPDESDLKPIEQVAVPRIDSPNLEDQLQSLKKVDGLPLILDPDQIGKENPYNN